MTSSRRAKHHGSSFLLLLVVPTLPVIAAPTDENPSDLVVTAFVRPDLFGTVAIPGPAGRWSDRWHRIASDDDRSAELDALIAPAKLLDRQAQLHFLQAAIDRRIGWRSDGTQYGERTYWARAGETLSSNVGDDDDRAILKFQALRALGFAPDTFYLMAG